MNLVASCIYLVLLALPSWSLASSFTDLGGLAFPEAVRSVAERGWLEGYPDGSFRPDEAVSRAELVATAVRLGPEAEDAALGCFADVPPSAWYAPAVCRAAAEGWIGGFPDGGFRPQAAASRAASLKVLLLARQLSAPQSGEPWHAPYAAAARNLGLTEYDDPTAPLTRAELGELLFSLERALARREGRPLGSSGCGPVANAPLASLTVNGGVRGLIVALPEPYDPQRPYPLVLAFHGRTGSNEEVRRYYGLEASGARAIYVYPAGLEVEGGFSWTSAEAGGLGYFDALLDALVQSYCVDLGRIFAVGHSLGASFVNELGCARGGVLRGIAALAGGGPSQACRGKTAAMLLHNPDDALVPFEEGVAARDRFVQQNELPDVSTPSEPSFLNCQRYGGADALFPVLWCPHAIDSGPGGDDYAHTWPRGTGEAVMAFFLGLP